MNSTDSQLPPPGPSVWPTIGFRDVDAAVRLLTGGFGFVITAMHHSEDGTLEHGEARWPDGGGIMFGARGKPGEWGALGPQGAYVVAAEPETVDHAWKRVLKLDGVEVLHELHDTDYGSHEFSVRDADGNLWTMGTYRGA
jgi:uncharacterized glyoxalase superfamily protein PhnB